MRLRLTHENEKGRNQCLYCMINLFDHAELPKRKENNHRSTPNIHINPIKGEGIIPAMRDAWDRHLCEEAVVIPQRARVYAQVIESSWLTNYRGPVDNTGGTMKLCPKGDPDGVLLGGEVRVPLHAEALFHCGGGDNNNDNFNLGMGPCDDRDTKIESAKQLSEPTLVLEFDFTSRQAIPPKTGRSVKKELKASDTGQANAIIFWWELDLFNNETYSTKAGEHWQDHWQQIAYILGTDQDGRYKELKKDELFSLVAIHDDYSISFQIETEIQQDSDSECNTSSKKRKISIGVPQHIPFERALQLNDRDRMSKLLSAIETALALKGREAEILDVSDFSLCSLIAANEFGAKKVTSIESSSGDVPMLSATVAQIGNALPKPNCKFQIINAHLEHLRLEHLEGGPADIVMSELYYEMMQVWNLPCALNYYYTLKSLKRRGLVKPDALSVPSFASVKCCAIEFHSCVVDAHCGLKTDNDGSSICNIKHDEAILYGQNFCTHDIMFPLWQYKWKRLSKDFELAKINYEGDATLMTISGDGEWCHMDFSTFGTCHAIVHWIDYGLKVQEKGCGEEIRMGFKVMTTGNKFNQQAVRMLPLPVSVDEDNIDSLRVSVKPLFANACQNMEDYCFEIKTVIT